MRDFNRDNKSGGWNRDKNFRRRDPRDHRFSNRYSDRPTMHKAICDECGRECEVPFEPTGDKPVYCSECFEKRGNVSSQRSGGRDSRRSSFGDKRMYKAVCDKCGNDCEVPFQPTEGKPIFCSQCFEKRDNFTERKSEQFTDQFEIINTKLDKILQTLTPVVAIKQTKKENVINIKKTSKPKKLVKKDLPLKKVVKKKTKAKKTAIKKKKIE